MTGYQESTLLILLCVGIMVFIALCAMLQAVPSTLPPSTPTLVALQTPTSTTTRSSTSTPTVQGIPTAADVATPTLAAEETLGIPLGIGIWDSENVAFFNRYAREQDVIGARPPYLDLLDDVEVGQRMFFVGGRDEPFTDIGSMISEARAIGVTMLGYNLETALPREELTAKEMQLQQIASDNDLVYAFGPTLAKLERYYEDFGRYADVLILQSQRYQTMAEYEEVVEELIERIRSTNPEVKVWVQVSVNPPQKREITPDEVIQHVELIADKADLIWIYFAPQRAPVMEEVFRRLRQ